MNNDEEPDFDVVIDTLQKRYDILNDMDKHVNEFTPFGIMQQIRMQHCHELKIAMKLWQDYKKANPEEFEW